MQLSSWQDPFVIIWKDKASTNETTRKKKEVLILRNRGSVVLE